MTNSNSDINVQRHWLDWCRLCANDYAVINVCKQEVYMKIISKVFDVEIGFEEPALGAKLCSECYSLIGDLLYFIDNVNKVQPIFELLRHTESNEQLDIASLRQQYGLPTTNLKNEPLQLDISIEREISNESEISPVAEDLEVKHFLLDDDSADEVKEITTPAPAKRKRGRPKSIKATNEPKLAINLQVERYEDDMEDELDESHTWLEDMQMETLNNKQDQSMEIEKLECSVSYEDLDIMSKSPIASDELLDDDYNEETTIKRKPGRPRKNHINKNENVNVSNCKNFALQRLLASPQQELPPDLDEDDQNNRRSVKCNICKKQLASGASLKIHNERVHMKKKTVVCDCCGKRVSTSSELKEHMLVHTEERPFACPLCNASFKNQKRLNVHSQTHGKPNFECQICGKKLQTRANWNKHKYVHSEERRFKCTICGTGHKHSTALKVHLLSHTGFRPYACKYCDKAFASSANCKDHKMKKHPVEYAKDDDKSSRIHAVPTLDELRALADSMEKGERLRKPRLMQK